jgi:hypothetical protein
MHHSLFRWGIGLGGPVAAPWDLGCYCDGVCAELTLICLCCTQVGWKHQAAVAELEVVRKERASAFYQEKKKQIALRAKAVAKVESGSA